MIKNNRIFLPFLLFLTLNVGHSFTSTTHQPTSSLFQQIQSYALRPLHNATQFVMHSMQSAVQFMGIAPQNHSQKSHSKKNGLIRSYTSADEKAVSEIAMQHMPKLVNLSRGGFGFQGTQQQLYELALTHEIIPALNTPTIIKKVYCCDTVPVGFITYVLFTDYAEILHLAVHNKHQKKGVGKALAQAAIDDCQAQSLDYITLLTVGKTHTNDPLTIFYRSLSFNIINRPSIPDCDTKWCKQLKTHKTPPSP